MPQKPKRKRGRPRLTAEAEFEEALILAAAQARAAELDINRIARKGKAADIAIEEARRRFGKKRPMAASTIRRKLQGWKSPFREY